MRLCSDVHTLEGCTSTTHESCKLPVLCIWDMNAHWTRILYSACCPCSTHRTMALQRLQHSSSTVLLTPSGQIAMDTQLMHYYDKILHAASVTTASGGACLVIEGQGRYATRSYHNTPPSYAPPPTLTERRQNHTAPSRLRTVNSKVCAPWACVVWKERPLAAGATDEQRATTSSRATSNRTLPSASQQSSLTFTSLDCKAWELERLLPSFGAVRRIDCAPLRRLAKRRAQYPQDRAKKHTKSTF